MLYGIAGRYRQVMELATEGVHARARTGSSLDQSEVLRNAAVVTITIDARFTDGLELARQAHALCVDGTNRHQLMHATWPVLAALYHLGRWDELWPVLDEHVAAFGHEPAIGCQFVRDGPVIGATVATQTGDLDRADRLAALVGDPLADLDSASAWQARLALAAGSPHVARQISQGKAREGRLYGPQHALSLLESLVALRDWDAVGHELPNARSNLAGNALLGPHCDRAEGLIHAEAGQPDAARRALRRALDGFDRLQVPLEAARTREVLATVEPAQTAEPLIEAARVTYRRLGVTGSAHQRPGVQS